MCDLQSSQGTYSNNNRLRNVLKSFIKTFIYAEGAAIISATFKEIGKMNFLFFRLRQFVGTVHI